MIEGPNQAICKSIWLDNRKLFATVPGSSCNHQAWPGGYQDHIAEGMNFLVVLYDTLCALRPLPFSLSDALVVFYFHDFEKLWKYEVTSSGAVVPIAALEKKLAQHQFRLNKLIEYGIVLTPEQENAMKYVEGEGADYSRTERKMGELAALCHLADCASARLFPLHPWETNDAWTGASRART